MKRNGTKKLTRLNARSKHDYLRTTRRKRNALALCAANSTILEVVQRGFVKDKQEAIHFAEFFWRVVAESANQDKGQQ